METKGSATSADLHIRDYLWSSKPQLRGDAIHATNFMFDFCLENQLSLKLAGDIFHTLAVLPEHVKVIFDRLDHMQEAGLPVYYIQGNHDLNKVPWLSLHKHPHNLHHNMIQVGGTNELIYGLQYTQEEQLKKDLENIPKAVNTLMMHQAETTAMPFGPNFDLDWVPDHIDTVLIGDIHSPQNYTNGPTTLYYPGSPCITSKEQDPQRSFLWETADGADKTKIERVGIPTRGVYHLDVDETSIDALGDIVSVIGQNDHRHYGMQPLIFIHYKPAVADVLLSLSLQLREKHEVYTWLEIDKPKAGEGAVVDRVKSEQRTSSDIPAVADVITNTIKDEDVRRMLLSIYTTEDVRNTMTAELEKIL